MVPVPIALLVSPSRPLSTDFPGEPMLLQNIRSGRKCTSIQVLERQAEEVASLCTVPHDHEAALLSYPLELRTDGQARSLFEHTLVQPPGSFSFHGSQVLQSGELNVLLLVDGVKAGE